MENKNYVAIRHNIPYYRQESTYLANNYKATKYASFLYVVNNDGSEMLVTINYSNDLEQLQRSAETAFCWYNYPANLCKNSHGIKHINEA